MSRELELLIIFEKVVVSLSMLSGLLVILFFLFTSFPQKNKLLKNLILLLVFSGVFIDALLQIGNWFLGSLLEYNNQLFNIYSLIFICFVFVIILKLDVSQQLKTISKVLYSSSILCVLIYAVFEQSFNFSNTFFYVGTSFLIIFTVIYYFLEKIKKVGDVSITKEPTFWFFTSLFIYVGLPLIITLFRELSGQISNIAFGYLWQIMNLSTFAFHLLIAKTLWEMRRE